MAPILLCSRSVIEPSLDQHMFTLDSSGVAGFFGGDEAVNAMTTVNLYQGRRWWGWYNTPGSYEIARRYGKLANSRLWNGLFPGEDQSPAELVGLAGKLGPRYIAARSGTVLHATGHMVHLLVRAAKEVPVATIPTTRVSSAPTVTLVDLAHAPDPKVSPRLVRTYSPLWAIFPIGASIVACVACGLAADYWSLGSIVAGILANGIACFIIGSGKLVFKHPTAAKGAPAGDGLLAGDEPVGIVILKGAEGAVTPITRGAFALDYPQPDPAYASIGWCASLLAVQFILQLLLIPQGTLFGQVMFVASLACSWLYNNYLSSLDKIHVQKEILLDVIRLQPKERIRRFKLGTRTASAVFACLVLQPKNTKAFLDELLPNNTDVWNQWKSTIAGRIGERGTLRFVDADWDHEELDEEEKVLLRSFYLDAQEAYDGYREHLDKGSLEGS